MHNIQIIQYTIPKTRKSDQFKRDKSIFANPEMTQIIKDFKTVTVTILHEIKVNMLEIKEKQKFLAEK